MVAQQVLEKQPTLCRQAPNYIKHKTFTLYKTTRKHKDPVITTDETSAAWEATLHMNTHILYRLILTCCQLPVNCSCTSQWLLCTANTQHLQERDVKKSLWFICIRVSLVSTGVTNNRTSNSGRDPSLVGNTGNVGSAADAGGGGDRLGAAVDILRM